jgi:hypothetical protein
MALTLELALAFAKNNLNIDEDDTSKDDQLIPLLEISKGKDKDDNPIYRPYVVAAFMLSVWAAIDRGFLISGDGATWLKPDDMSILQKNLLALQGAMDCSLTGIDPCWSIAKIEMDLGLAKAKGVTLIVV